MSSTVLYMSMHRDASVAGRPRRRGLLPRTSETFSSETVRKWSEEPAAWPYRPTPEPFLRSVYRTNLRSRRCSCTFSDSLSGTLSE